MVHSVKKQLRLFLCYYWLLALLLAIAGTREEDNFVFDRLFFFKLVFFYADWIPVFRIGEKGVLWWTSSSPPQRISSRRNTGVDDGR